jgi:hypothetical protein
MVHKRSCPLIALAFLLTICSASQAAGEAALHPLFLTGPTKSRINLVIIAEGYTESQLPLFLLHAEYLATHLFTGEPFQTYRNYFNVYALSVASAQSGSDHPSRGVFKDTYFNSSYDSYGLAHALTIPPNDWDPDIANGYGKAYELLEPLLPDWGLLVFLVNELSSGAWGDKRGVVCAANSVVAEITAHELGHTLAGLGDEYDLPFPGDPEPVVEEPNTTQETRREFIKWRAWIEESTPVPTPDAEVYADLIGLFEGARYQSQGWYRPKRGCRMNYSSHPFCEVCREELVKSIYRRTGAVEGISPESDELTLASADQVDLSVIPMQPATGAVKVDWFIDGRKVAQDSTSLSVSGSDLGLGTYQVEAIAWDTTTWVRNDSEGALLTRVTWQIKVEDPAPRESWHRRRPRQTESIRGRRATDRDR